jgi:hypothetical protein
MDKTKRLAQAYDAIPNAATYANVPPPTAASVARINEMLGIALPQSLVEFATQSSACSSWLAGLGEDYASPNHILQINKRANKIRRRVIGDAGNWEAVKPKNFVPFNLGFDHDYNCFDTAQFDATIGEYTIQYWSPPRITGTTTYSTFYAYMEAQIRDWANHSKRVGGLKVLALLDDPTTQKAES